MLQNFGHELHDSHIYQQNILNI